MASSLKVTAESSEALETIGHLINGQLVDDKANTQPVYNPAIGREIRRVSLADKTTTENAIAAAQAAFPAWRAVTPAKRARIMFRFKDLLEKNADEICRLLTEEHGKVFADSMGELQRAIENVEYACYAPETLKGEHSRYAGPGVDSWSEFQPLGVVAGITPFNFPVMVPAWMFPAAIVAGNTFVLKPSEKDPTSTMFVAQLLKEAGLPDGVLNVVNGGKDAVDTLLSDPRVQAVSFVGSTPIAEYVYTKGTAHGKRVQALGGAKNHAIVMPDAELENAANALMGAAYGSCGERCMAIPVIVAVGDETGDAVVEKLSAKLGDMKVGNGLTEGNDMGPLVTYDHYKKVRGYVDLGVEEGANLVVDGRDINVPGHSDGYYLGGCLFDNVKPHMKIYTDEIFGPVLSVLRVETLREAMALIDDHEYGTALAFSPVTAKRPDFSRTTSRWVWSG